MSPTKARNVVGKYLTAIPQLIEDHKLLYNAPSMHESGHVSHHQNIRRQMALGKFEAAVDELKAVLAETEGDTTRLKKDA